MAHGIVVIMVGEHSCCTEPARSFILYCIFMEGAERLTIAFILAIERPNVIESDCRGCYLAEFSSIFDRNLSHRKKHEYSIKPTRALLVEFLPRNS